MDDTSEVRTKRSFNRQADAKVGTDQAFDAFAAYIMSHHLWPVCWRGRVRNPATWRSWQR
jgi:hypothetical protein